MIKIRCELCGRKLDFNDMDIDEDGNISFEIYPCTKCSQDSYDNGVDGGFDEGYQIAQKELTERK